MSCVEMTARRCGQALEFSAFAPEMRVASGRKGEEMTFLVLSDMVSADAFRIGKGIEFSASLVCTIPQDRYLFVLSDEVVWLVAENNYSADVEVKSNVRWTIE